MAGEVQRVNPCTGETASGDGMAVITYREIGDTGAPAVAMIVNISVHDLPGSEGSRYGAFLEAMVDFDTIRDDYPFSVEGVIWTVDSVQSWTERSTVVVTVDDRVPSRWEWMSSDSVCGTL